MFGWLRQVPECKTPGRGKWLLCLGVSFCAAALLCWPQALPWLRYDRAGLLAGQAWRLLTGHLVHLNDPHLLFNLLGLALICELLWGTLPVRHGAALLAVSSLAISAMLWWRHPDLVWYAGLSGALHGLWAGCALFALERVRGEADGSGRAWPLSRTIALLGALLLAVKLWAEYRHGAAAATVAGIGAPVVTVAHLYGALAGVAYVLAWRAARFMTGRI